MPNYTPNYNLKKPLSNENYNVEDQNNNMDIIDEKLKEAMDKAEQAFTQANDGKESIAAVIGDPADSGDTFLQLAEHISNAKLTMATNLTIKGVIAQATEALSALAAKIANIIRGSGNAQPSDVLEDKTFSNDDGPGQVGTMPNRTGHVAGQSISRSGTTLRIRPQTGYYAGDSGNSVTWNEPNWKAENIARDVSMFGLVGTHNTMAVSVGDTVLCGLEKDDSDLISISTSFEKKKAFILHGIKGAIRVSFKLRKGEGSALAYGRIYINGSAIGTLRSAAGLSDITFTEDFDNINPGDEVALYLRTSGSGVQAICSSFKIMTDNSILEKVL